MRRKESRVASKHKKNDVEKIERGTTQSFLARLAGKKWGQGGERKKA